MAVEKRLLITGCGRSGTKFAASLLQHLGLDVRHEEMGADGIATWCMAVQSDDSPWGGGRRSVKFATILHQVRHPLAVIPSLTTFTPPSWEFIAQHVSCPISEPILLRAAKYWYYWNLEAEKIAQWRYRIETLPNIFPAFCSRVGVKPDPTALAKTSTMVNSRKTRPALRWARYILDRLRLVPSKPAFDFLYNRNSCYLGHPFTWDVLEQHAPGWSKRIAELSIRYGYTAQDDLIAAGLSHHDSKDIQDGSLQPIGPIDTDTLEQGEGDIN